MLKVTDMGAFSRSGVTSLVLLLVAISCDAGTDSDAGNRSSGGDGAATGGRGGAASGTGGTATGGLKGSAGASIVTSGGRSGGGSTSAGGSAKSGNAGSAGRGGAAIATGGRPCGPAANSGGESGGAGGADAPTGGTIDSHSGETSLADAKDCVGKIDGPLCNGSTYVYCRAERVEQRTSCGTLGCGTDNQCVTPSAGTAAAEEGAHAQGSCDAAATTVCGTCLRNLCCAAQKACTSQAECQELWACHAACTTDTCRANCAASHAEVTVDLGRLFTCASSNCATECGVTDPCTVFPFPQGYSCAANLGVDDDPSRLYYCKNARTLSSVACGGGCYAAPLGEQDECRDCDPCSNTAYDGKICGASLSPRADQAALYDCFKQKTAGTTRCTTRCVPAAPGTPHYCQ
jgi:hypothetical protein